LFCCMMNCTLLKWGPAWVSGSPPGASGGLGGRNTSLTGAHPVRRGAPGSGASPGPHGGTRSRRPAGRRR
jgi:hypothetical protein